MTKGHEGTFGSDGYIRYLDCGDGITGVYMLKLTTLYTLSTLSLYIYIYYIELNKYYTQLQKFKYINYNLIKLFLKKKKKKGQSLLVLSLQSSVALRI